MSGWWRRGYPRFCQPIFAMKKKHIYEKNMSINK